MLDLTQKRKLYKIKWVDGSVLSLNPPTQKQYLQIQALQDAKEYGDIINSVYDTTNEILNKNDNDKQVKADELELEVCLLILKDYFEFYQKQMESKVVFQQSQH